MARSQSNLLTPAIGDASLGCRRPDLPCTTRSSPRPTRRAPASFTQRRVREKFQYQTSCFSPAYRTGRSPQLVEEVLRSRIWASGMKHQFRVRIPEARDLRRPTRSGSTDRHSFRVIDAVGPPLHNRPVNDIRGGCAALAAAWWMAPVVAASYSECTPAYCPFRPYPVCSRPEIQQPSSDRLVLESFAEEARTPWRKHRRISAWSRSC